MQPREEMAQGDLTAVCNCLIGGCRENRDRVFSEVHRDRIRGQQTQYEIWEFPF